MSELTLPFGRNLPSRILSRRTFLKTSGAAVAGAALLPACATTPESPTTHPTADANERDLILYALDKVMAAGADYADVHITRNWSQGVGVREEKLVEASRNESYGIGVRALVGGSWGFSATRNMERDEIAQIAREAADIAKANDSVVPGRVELAPVEAYPHAYWETPHDVDSETIPIEEKAELLFAANRAALGVKGVRFVFARIQSVKEERLTATSDGSLIHQRLVRVNPMMQMTAISDDGSDFQSRGSVVEPTGLGWEYVRDCDLVGNAPRWAEEAVAKLSAKPVEPGTYDLIVHPSNLWLTIHESIGHPTELDRAYGYEANYAGTSFISPPEKMINQLRLGPEFMQFVGDRTQYGGCATIGWDDEGVPAEQWPLIKDGVMVDYQTTREQAAWIAELTGVHRSHGCSYGMDWKSMPFQRMPNVSLLPNPKDLSEDEVIAACDRGVYVEGRGSYSIDQQRYNFQFGGQVFWEVRNGKKVRPLRDVAYQGRTPEFWNSLGLIGGRQTYFLGSSFSDAKGQPIQLNAVSHGCPIALFRGVNILNTA
jgi:TldD protein